MRNPRLAPVAGLLVAVARMAAPCLAQSTRAAVPSEERARHAVTVNLLPLAHGGWSGAYAAAIGGRATLGVSATYLGEHYYRLFEESGTRTGRDLFVDLNLHSYLESQPFRGPALVLHVGAYSERTWIDRRGRLGWVTAPTLGLSVEYMAGGGRRGDLVIVGGLGLKTVLGRGSVEGEPFPLFNLSAGFLF